MDACVYVRVCLQVRRDGHPDKCHVSRYLRCCLFKRSTLKIFGQYCGTLSADAFGHFNVLILQTILFFTQLVTVLLLAVLLCDNWLQTHVVSADQIKASPCISIIRIISAYCQCSKTTATTYRTDFGITCTCPPLLCLRKQAMSYKKERFYFEAMYTCWIFLFSGSLHKTCFHLHPHPPKKKSINLFFFFFCLFFFFLRRLWGVEDADQGRAAQIFLSSGRTILSDCGLSAT